MLAQAMTAAAVRNILFVLRQTSRIWLYTRLAAVSGAIVAELAPYRLDFNGRQPFRGDGAWPKHRRPSAELRLARSYHKAPGTWRSNQRTSAVPDPPPATTRGPCDQHGPRPASPRPGALRRCKGISLLRCWRHQPTDHIRHAAPDQAGRVPHRIAAAISGEGGRDISNCAEGRGGGAPSPTPNRLRRRERPDRARRSPPPRTNAPERRARTARYGNRSARGADRRRNRRRRPRGRRSASGRPAHSTARR